MELKALFERKPPDWNAIKRIRMTLPVIAVISIPGQRQFMKVRAGQNPYMGDLGEILWRAKDAARMYWGESWIHSPDGRTIAHLTDYGGRIKTYGKGK